MTSTRFGALVGLALGAIVVFAGFAEAALVAFLTAVGFVAVHLAPHWSIFSDPYGDRYLDSGSWIQMLTALAGGAWLAYEGWRLVGGRDERAGVAATG